jgi:hypothetical protein
LGRIVINPENGNIVKVSKRTLLAMITFQNYLNAIYQANDVDSLLIRTTRVELELSKLKVTNSFRSGFTDEGFGVYNILTNERMIFVECETNFEKE